jgi:thiamine biosynthesis lipoprotein
VVRLTGETMGTGWSAQLVAAPPGLAPALRATLARMVAAMSQWDAESALSAFNRSPIGEWQDIPDTLATVLDAALTIRAASDGAFDPAAGALADLWGFGPPGWRRDVPDAAAVTAALNRSGADAIERSGARARRLRDVQLDLSGIGKGHAVDALAETCRAHGCEDFLVEIGGEFVGSGIQPSGQPWWIDLESPPGIALAPLRVAAHGVAVATSGNYRRFVAVGGRRFSHTVDPRTGWPIDTGIASVSVVAPDCMTADGWATALTVLGRDAGMALAARERLAVRMVMEDGGEVLSPALTAMLEG